MMDYQEKQPLGFGDFSTFAANHMMQGFDPHHDLFGLHPGMEMMGIPASTSKPPNPNPSPSPSPSPWSVDDSSLLCLLPRERTQLQQTTEGLALSLRNPAQDPQQQQLFMEDGRLFQLPQGANYLKSSRYLVAAQQLLVEVCNLGTDGGRGTKRRPTKPGQLEEGRPSSSLNQSLLQLQKRKAKLLLMLEEVDRKYRKYCEQMRAVVASFEAVAGEGAATVYSTLASKAMSKHFRCLRDGIIGQIQATKTAMGDKDTVMLETTRGETPRLKLLDQHLRQQRAFQQAGTVEGQPWRPQRGLPDRAVSVLRAWLFEHFLHPYPSDIDKHILARQTGLSRSQVSNWFINARVRLWKPMVEEMYTDEVKEQDKQSSHASTGLRHDGNRTNPNPSPYPFDGESRKPDLGQLPTDADSLASVISSARHAARRDERVSRGGDGGFGAIDLDFSSYSNFGGLKFGSDVSLTLGLKHHKGSGMTLSFSREQMGGGDAVQPAQFSIVEGSLVGDQLLHDLAS